MERNWAIYLARRLWDFHPGVRSGNELTMGERAADRLRNGMGSWAFVFVTLLFLATWMAFNRNTGFDPYPFILLNLLLSCVAALQGAVLLIAAPAPTRSPPNWPSTITAPTTRLSNSSANSRRSPKTSRYESAEANRLRDHAEWMIPCRA
ncbi:MAG: DUF1003 domain-containing protein [Acidimicrobiia bacterium]|nr:DUF1003 domain-containing protein [Acidimicrobiia bacterium]